MSLSSLNQIGDDIRCFSLSGFFAALCSCKSLS